MKDLTIDSNAFIMFCKALACEGRGFFHALSDPFFPFLMGQKMLLQLLQLLQCYKSIK